MNGDPDGGDQVVGMSVYLGQRTWRLPNESALALPLLLALGATLLLVDPPLPIELRHALATSPGGASESCLTNTRPEGNHMHNGICRYVPETGTRPHMQDCVVELEPGDKSLIDDETDTA